MPFQNKLITINGKEVGFVPGESVLRVANRNRIFIPTLCYDPNLSISGHCKVCFVQINGKLKGDKKTVLFNKFTECFCNHR
jgi:NADH dehydrogenase/NADH:ubiquinone oxidoreductase subunit G